MQRGTTMVELVVAAAILTVVFAAVMPVFAAIRNHAATAGAGSEMVQNARVLNEQLYRHLAQARRITAVSEGSATDGYLDFETRDGVVRSCRLGASGYIEFGPAGELCELAGPAERLTFTCYDGNDPAVQTDVPARVRLVTWEARLNSAGALATDKTIGGACYLRVGAGAGGEETSTTYDFATGRQGVDCVAFAGQGKPQAPTGLTTPSTPLNSGQYDAIEVQDGTFHSVHVTDESNYAQTRLVFQIQEHRADVSSIAAAWRGKGVNEHSSRTDGARLYLWNYTSGEYELLQASPDTEAEVTLSGVRTDVPARYVGGASQDVVVLLAVSNDKKTGHKADTLFTDYVRLDITAQSARILP